MKNLKLDEYVWRVTRTTEDGYLIFYGYFSSEYRANSFIGQLNIKDANVSQVSLYTDNEYHYEITAKKFIIDEYYKKQEALKKLTNIEKEVLGL